MVADLLIAGSHFAGMTPTVRDPQFVRCIDTLGPSVEEIGEPLDAANAVLRRPTLHSLTVKKLETSGPERRTWLSRSERTSESYDHDKVGRVRKRFPELGASLRAPSTPNASSRRSEQALRTGMRSPDDHDSDRAILYPIC